MVAKILRWLIHFLSRIMVWVYIKPLYRYRILPGSDSLPPAPFIMIANHGTFFDPWMVGVHSTAPVSYMCNDDAFRSPPVVSWYLDKIGAFPKKKGASDYKAMKEVLRRLKRKSPVCIFPEGQTTWDGTTQLMYKGLEKVIKRAKCPLVMFNLSGNFLIKPWWARYKRKGRVFISVKVLSAEQLQTFSDDALFARMKEHLANNDIAEGQKRPGDFSGEKCAEGAERLFWLCPFCKSSDTLHTRNNEIVCEACKNSLTLDATGQLQSEMNMEVKAVRNVKEWADWQAMEAKARIKDAGMDDLLTENDAVDFFKLEGAGYRFETLGKGHAFLTKKNITLSPLSPDTGEVSFELDAISDPVVQKKDIFEFRVDTTYYRLLFHGKSPMKWVTFLRYLKGFEECEKRGFL